jgi:hypothetical protein
MLLSRLSRLSALGIALLLAAGSGCSSDKEHRDKNYGTDAGAGYQLPDGGARDSVIDADEVTTDATSDGAGDGSGEIAAGSPEATAN